ncbi:energy transducer TonB [Rhodocyclus tenuis]|uniref:energy transducer TonB n=1 Tax=Rhodocyclus tenuis TaxID=1066 RepID=UPI001902E229|nr:hypothetical protein [Rhodocyclus tenuis]MBK1680036.1 hypothetical protein [Rhodocyclus tenuis]
MLEELSPPSRGRWQQLQLALLASLALHTFLLLLSPSPPRFHSYPPPLAVNLPRQAPPAAAEDASAAVSPRPAAPEVAPSDEVPADIVELTPQPQPPERAAQTAVYIPAALLAARPVLENPEWLDSGWPLPAQARGDVVVTLRISKDGVVDEVLVEEGAASELADWLKREIPLRARFTPGRWRDVPVATELRVRLSLDAVVRR